MSGRATGGAEVAANGLMEGCWAVCHWDYSEVIEAVYMTEIAALRAVNQRGYGHVKFLKWGELDGRS